VRDTDTGKMGKFDPNANHVYQEIAGQIGGIWGAPVYFKGSVYYGPVGDVIKAFQLQVDNTLTTSPTSNSPEGFGYPGPNPSISADGSSDGIVWAVDSTAYGYQGPAVLHAYDATNLGNELYSSGNPGNRDTAGGAVKFIVPTVTNGMVYVGGEYALTIYGLINGVVVPARPTKLKATALSSGQISLTWQNNSANETGFTIERSTDGINFSPVSAIGAYLHSYTDGGLSPSTRYFYQVIATNAAGASPASNTAFARTQASNLPVGWSDTDIGGPAFPGSASYKNGVFTVFGSGNDIWNPSDQFHYVYTTITGDATIVARVVSEQYTDQWAKAGVMIRQSLDADSPDVDAFVTLGNGVDFQWRPAQGAGATWNGYGVFSSAPYWVKLVRAGTTFTGYASPDGQNWTNIGSVVVPMSTQVYVGLCLTAHNDGAINESTFDYVNVIQARTRGYVAIEAGGGPTGTFQADQDVSGGNTYQTSSAINLGGVTDPAPMGVYQSERYGTFTYTIPGLRRNQLYTVRLHFSENFDTQIGQRVFDVSINGTPVLTNFDILAAAGNNMFTAVVEQFSATPSASGTMLISFSPSNGSPDPNAKVDGIELVPVRFNRQIAVQPVDVSAVAGQPFSGTLATFLDSDPGGLARDYVATINWGDGTTTTGTIQPDPSGSGFDVVGSHTYTKAGHDTVGIVIQSYNGAGARISETITVTAGSGSGGLSAIVAGAVPPPTILGANPFSTPAPGGGAAGPWRRPSTGSSSALGLRVAMQAQIARRVKWSSSGAPGGATARKLLD
jgi:hypothetical protein